MTANSMFQPAAASCFDNNINPLDNFGTPVCRILNQIFSTPVGVARLRRNLGWKGYGIYCALIEMLAQLPSLSFVCDYEIVAFKLGASADIVREVIENFGLFCKEGAGLSECFYSPELRKFNNTLEYARMRLNRYTAAVCHSAENERCLATGQTQPNPAIATVATVSGASDIATAATVAGASTAAGESSENSPKSEMAASKRSSGQEAGSSSFRPGYSLSENRDRLREDKKWLHGVAIFSGKDRDLMPSYLDAFADYVESREDITHKSENDMRSHFINWLKRGYGDAAAKAAKKRETQLKAQIKKEEARRRELEEYKAHASQCITYAEFCRRSGRDSTGNIVDDIARDNKKRQLENMASSLS